MLTTLFVAPSAGAETSSGGQASVAQTERLYVTAQSGGITALGLSADGTPRPLPGSPYTSGAGTFNLVTTPDHRYMYGAAGLGLGSPDSTSQPPQLETFRIAKNGTLARVGAPLPLPNTPVSMAVSADGRHLFLGLGDGIAGFNNGAIASFTIGRDGVPVPNGAPVKLGTYEDGAAMPVLSKDGKALYVTSYLAKSIVRFAVHRDGTLSGPLQRIDAGDAPITPAVAPDGRTLYIANETGGTVRAFTIAADHSLRSLAAPFPSGGYPHNFSFGRNGRQVYVANTMTNDVSGYSVRADGTLTPLPGSPYAGGPEGTMPDMPLLSADGRRLYVVDYQSAAGPNHANASLRVYHVRRDGGLVPDGRAPYDLGIRGSDGPSALLASGRHF
ncbi:lactonase family protein [Embleya sp. MST-111070]|uniref:lactonase family protein n=1 Tax=Embleya sp. MST-111070 TaxID=3398231 RepID=UPI003F73DDE0